MTTPARNRITQGVTYESDEQNAFALSCSLSHGFALPSFDDFVDDFPEGAAKDELLDWREKAFRAFKRNDHAEMKAWLQNAWTVWKVHLRHDAIRPTLEIGTNYSRQQSERAKKPRGKLSPDSDGGPTIREVISSLALSDSEELCEETAKGLWPHFFSKLDEMLLEPEEHAHDDPKKVTITYDFNSDRKKITLGRFSNIVSDFRKNKSR